MARKIHLDDWPEISLWLCPLLEWPSALEQTWLSNDEIERSRRFVHSVHRRRFVAARVALRSLLASRLGVAPGTLRFSTGSDGKPSLAGQEGTQFNLSHSEDWALVGASAQAVIGVDLERLRPVDEA